ncbi:MAG: family phosphorylase, partial [Deltaproteobacteria bacterium]|nr:family phosphorylase [Deltaproteobacteria bacterium]
MDLFRIAKTKYINDLSGNGARVYGGRWNEKGVAVIYTSESRALAALEFLVHTPMALAPKDLSMLTI